MEDATWEDEEFIQKHPHFPIIEDNAYLKRVACYSLNIRVHWVMNSWLVVILTHNYVILSLLYCLLVS
jgi:hypothetical protein